MIYISTLVILGYITDAILAFTLSDEQGELLDSEDFTDSLSVLQYLLYYGRDICNLLILVIVGVNLV